MSLQHPLARAKGLGSAKDGTGHWWALRLSSVALALLTPWFVVFIVGMIGADQDAARAAIARPATALALSTFMLTLFWHAQQGLQVVIEDYVHGAAELVLQVLVKFVCFVAVVASLLAIGRIYFTA
jgi:succinate dehydrogenase / fumarate reductase, membrane anchor subunit